MFLRFLGNASQHQFFRLERDIVLNKMTPVEIRTRYLRDLSGPDMAQWLDEALAALDLKEELLLREQESAKQKVKEIAGSNAEYRTERNERAATGVNQLKKAISDCLSQYDILTLQSEFFVEGYKTREEREALKQRLAALTERSGKFKNKVMMALELLDSLRKVVDQGGDVR
jgi:uncharacterized coiled-coil DUF342 family protein